jgi:phosphodiesterase/alkaline phosphatase D-like protein
MADQRARELTSQEVAEGEAHISTEILTATQIQALVRNMDHSKKKWRHLRGEAFMEKLKAENENLFFNFPALWQMHAEDRLDSTFFEMLALKRKIEKGEMTDDAASTIMGQRLFQRFAPAIVNSNAAGAGAGGTGGPPAMSYTEYYQKFGGT